MLQNDQVENIGGYRKINKIDDIYSFIYLKKIILKRYTDLSDFLDFYKIFLS